MRIIPIINNRTKPIAVTVIAKDRKITNKNSSILFFYLVSNQFFGKQNLSENNSYEWLLNNLFLSF